MHNLSKRELLGVIECAIKENDRLRSENNKLGRMLVDATEQIKSSNDLAECYQRMFDQLFQVIKTEYDPDFTIEDIPKHLSK